MAKNLEVYEGVKRWLKKLQSGSRSANFQESSTYRSALHWLRRFCEYTKSNPDSLIADRKVTVQSRDEVTQRKHEELVEDFALDMRTKNAAPNTISTAVGLIRSFYADNYVELKKVETVRPRPIRRSKTPSPEDLRKMVKIADLPTKAWICCAKDSGLANIDLFSISYMTLSGEFGTVKTQLKKGICPIHIELWKGRQKTGEKTDTFFGPNAIEAVQEYSGGSTTGKIFRFSARFIQQRIKALGIHAKVASKEIPITPYSLRRFFNTRMKAVANVNNDIVELWMGHSISRVQSAYLNIGASAITGLPISELAKKYMDAYWAIDIREELEASRVELPPEILSRYLKAKEDGFSGDPKEFITQAVLQQYKNGT
jgi:integrase